jgi:predicted amidohydrolase YtcJ
MRLLAWLALACCAGPQRPAAPAPADLLLRNGKVFVAAGSLSTAVAVRADRVVALGADAEALAGPRTRVVDLRGRLVTPGMNDAHCHFAAGGVAMLEVDLRGAVSLAEIERRVRAAAAAAGPGEWITGRGWDQTRLPAAELGPGGWPTRETLDRASPDHPVYLRRVDGHTGWASTRALRLAGVDARTADPQGGEIVRDARGEPTGILKEKAQALVARVVPPPGPEKRRRGILAALDLAAHSGVTSVQTEADPEDLAAYRSLRQQGRLTVRVYAWLPLTLENVRAFESRGERAAAGDVHRRAAARRDADGRRVDEVAMRGEEARVAGLEHELLPPA